MWYCLNLLIKELNEIYFLHQHLSDNVVFVNIMSLYVYEKWTNLVVRVWPVSYTSILTKYRKRKDFKRKLWILSFIVVYDNTVKRQTILLQLSLVKFTTLVQLFCQIISQKSFIDDDEDGPNTTKKWKFLLFCSNSNNITVRSQTIICKYIPCAATYAPFLLQP